ncbi:MAG: PAS domain S-box protein, partial [Acidobacteria bacterium]|nr:PAS domain S-box protein [Acidobacteriota bacterium]
MHQRLLRYSVGIALAVGSLFVAKLLDNPQIPLALMCTFAVLISALAGGPVAGWLSLAVSAAGFWLVPPPGDASKSSILVLWSAYVGLGCVLVEVIRHMQSERRKLLERDERLRLAGRAARIWFWEWELKRNVLRWSRENESSREQAHFREMPLDAYLKERVHPEDRDRLLTALFESAARGERLEIDYRIVEEDGSLHWLSTKGKIFENNGASVMLGMASEITTQKQAQEVRSHYRAVLGSLIEGVCYVNTAGEIQYINGAAERMLGYTPNEIEGKNFHELVHSDCRQNGTSCCLSQALESQRSCHAQEDTFTTKSGEQFTAEYTAAPVTDEVVLGAVITFRDISERKRAEAALRSSEKMAATGRMAATISHELRNPLDSVMQILYLLKQSPNLGESEHQYLELADQELRRMTEVAQQTLAMHRQASSMVPVNVARLIDGVMLLYGKKLRSQKIQIDRRYEWDGEVPAFPAELRQVFTNLIVNAVDAMPQGGHLCIHVRASREPVGQRRQGVLISLRDTGSGIPPETRKRIFEPFFTTKGEKGSGVGLWVSRGVVQRHSGRIW